MRATVYAHAQSHRGLRALSACAGGAHIYKYKLVLVALKHKSGDGAVA